MRKFTGYGLLVASIMGLYGCNSGNNTGSDATNLSAGQQPATKSTNTAKLASKSDSLTKDGYLPLKIVNATGLSNQPVYIFAKAGLKENPNDDNSPVVDCIISFNQDGMGSCIKVDSNTDIAKYSSVSLNQLPHDSAGNAIVYIPHVLSGRMYFSVASPLSLSMIKDADNHLRIVDPDGFKPRDVNYYTLYDKVEFSFVNDYLDKDGHEQKGGVWFNPTAVDFFSLPMQIEDPTSVTFNHVGISGSREQVMDKIISVMKDNTDAATYSEWSKLILRYHNSAENSTILRVMSPGKAMVDNIKGTKPFNKNYLKSYIDALWAYYRKPGHTVTINCQELENKMKLNNYMFTGHVDNNDRFVFINTDGSYPVEINKPTDSIPFFAGAVGPFDAANNTPKAIIIRELTSAFEAGLLPAPSDTVLNKSYFEHNRSLFYTNNMLLNLTSNGPWYDLYSKALHSFGSSQPIYTFAYDDALGQDGTLHEPNGTNPGMITITLENMLGTTIPAPYNDQNHYNVTIQIGETKSGLKSTIEYNGRNLSQNETVANVAIPMVVKVNGITEKLYFNPQMVMPQADGIVINQETGTNNVVIQFPGP